MSYYIKIAGVKMPVAPSRVVTTHGSKNEVLKLVNGQDFNLLKLSPLVEYEITMLLPNSFYSFSMYDNGFKRAMYYINHLTKLKNSKKGVKFELVRRINNTKLDNTSMTVSVEKFEIIEDAETNGEDVLIKLYLKEYKSYSSKKKGTSKKSSKSPLSPTNKAKVHIVKKGESLWLISKKYYGKGEYYDTIYNANKSKIKNKNMLTPGQKLVIPVLNKS